MSAETITRFAMVAREFAGGEMPASNGRNPYPTKQELATAYLYIVEGLTMKEISQQLVLSIKTIESHMARFKKKCGLVGTVGRHGSWLPIHAAYWRAAGRDEARAEVAAS